MSRIQKKCGPKLFSLSPLKSQPLHFLKEKNRSRHWDLLGRITPIKFGQSQYFISCVKFCREINQRGSLTAFSWSSLWEHFAFFLSFLSEKNLAFQISCQQSLSIIYRCCSLSSQLCLDDYRNCSKLKGKTCTSASAASSSQQDAHDRQDDQDESRHPQHDPVPQLEVFSGRRSRCKRKDFIFIDDYVNQ